MYVICQLGQIILQLFNAYFAYRIWRMINGKWGLALPIGFLLMGLRRITALHGATPTIDTPILLLDKIILPLIISILLFVGMKRISKATKREVDKRHKVEQNLENLKRLTRKLDNGSTKK